MNFLVSESLVEQLVVKGRLARAFVIPSHTGTCLITEDFCRGSFVSCSESKWKALRLTMTIVFPGAYSFCIAIDFKGVETNERLPSCVFVAHLAALFTSDDSCLSLLRLEHELCDTFMIERIKIPGPLHCADIVAFFKDPLAAHATSLTVFTKLNLFFFCSDDNLYASEKFIVTHAVIDGIDSCARLPLILENFTIVDPITIGENLIHSTNSFQVKKQA